MKKTECQRTFERHPDKLAFLTGYSARAVAALIHLREAFVIADSKNAASIALAMRAILTSHSLAPVADRVRPLVLDGLDDEQAATLWRLIAPVEPAPGAKLPD